MSTQRKPITSLAIIVTVLSLAVMLGTQTAFAANGAATTPRQVAVHTQHLSALGPLASVGNPYCQSSPSDVHCDGYDVGLSNCGPNNGAYWVGTYPNETAFVEAWWSPHCQSNYIYLYVPSKLYTCYDTNNPCNAVAEAWINRAPYSASYCRSNNVTCQNAAGSHVCQSPGNCGTGAAQLYYCDEKANNPPHVNCTSSTTFNGEFIGSGSQWWPSFETDMLYSPVYSVQGCAFFVNSNHPLIESPEYCSSWH